MATLVLVFFAMLVLPVYLQSKITTVPELLGRRYDQRSRYAFSGFTVLTAMLIDSAGGLFAGALVLGLLYPDVPLMVHVVIIAALGGIYVVLGGLRAVMVTDTIQEILLYVWISNHVVVQRVLAAKDLATAGGAPCSPGPCSCRCWSC